MKRKFVQKLCENNALYGILWGFAMALFIMPSNGEDSSNIFVRFVIAFFVSIGFMGALDSLVETKIRYQADIEASNAVELERVKK